MSSDAPYLVRPEDDSLHDNDGHPYWNESSWVPFHVADRGLSGIIYFYHRPNMNFTKGGVMIWDPSGENTYDSRHYDFDIHPFDVNDMYDFTLPNGLTVQCREPLTSFAFRYQRESCGLELNWNAVMPPQQTGLPQGAKEWADKGHYQQGGRATGELLLDGERIAIDCLTVRDHSWGKRLLRQMNDPRGDLLWAMASPDHGMCVYVAADPDENDDTDYSREVVDTVGVGWYLRDGDTRPVTSIKRRSLRGDDGRVTELVVDGQDDRGRSFHAHGTPANLLKWQAYNAIMSWYSLMRFTLDDKPAMGETTDYWPINQASRMLRSLRANGGAG